MKATPSRVVLCISVAALLSIATPIPALANPPSIPDQGARPDGSSGGGSDLEPGEVPQSGPGIGRGPFADKIAEQTRTLADLGERTTAAEERLNLRSDETTNSRQNWLDIDAEANETSDLASEMAAVAYQEKAAQIPGLTEEFDRLFQVNPELLNLDQHAIAEEAEEAREDAGAAKASMDAAVASEAIAKTEHSDLSKDLDEKTSTLETLIEKNREAIATEEKQAEADNERKIGDLSSKVEGTRASDEAKQAVTFALEQTGKPYVWGEEGPSTYDCSGLTQSSYGTPGVDLPRVAAEQFRHTSQTQVKPQQLLPGDLIFYGDRPGDWMSVYHVGMYIGDGQMVHAPRPGDVVKVAPVWFDEFVGAHRVVEAIDTTPPEKEKEKDDPKSPKDTPATKPESTPIPSPSDGSTSGPGPEPGGGDAPTPTPTPYSG